MAGNGTSAASGRSAMQARTVAVPDRGQIGRPVREADPGHSAARTPSMALPAGRAKGVSMADENATARRVFPGFGAGALDHPVRYASRPAAVANVAICGHVFCFLLALVLQKGLADRCRATGGTVEWDDLIRDLDRLQEATIEKEDERITTRTHVEGQVGQVFHAVGIALPPNWRERTACPLQNQRNVVDTPGNVGVPSLFYGILFVRTVEVGHDDCEIEMSLAG